MYAKKTMKMFPLKEDYMYMGACVCIDIKYWASFFYKKKKERNAIL